MNLLYNFFTTLYLIVSIKSIKSIKFDYSKIIKYNLPKNKINIIKKINGFYGLIGPNLDLDTDAKKKDIKMYDYFANDGIVQGVFFDNGEITFINSIVKTEKFLFEQQYGEIPRNPLIIFIFMLLNKLNKLNKISNIKKLPNMNGFANTALLNIEKKLYALYEMDQPYLLDLDFNNKKISTINKIESDNFEHFSGHSKYNECSKSIETIEYYMDKNIVNFYELNNNFSIINSVNFKLNYMPLIHDFYSGNDKIYLIDMPLEIDYNKVLIKKMPIQLNKEKPTNIYIYNKIDQKKEVYIYNNGIFLFHYANIIETKNYIKIFAPIYDDFDFSDLNIYGKYRLILINKNTKEVSVIKNKELELYNLDFPIKYDDKIILYNKEKDIINGFIICKDLQIIKKIIFTDRNIKGEHNIIEINNKKYLIFFNEKEQEDKKYKKKEINRNYISILDLDFVLESELNVDKINKAIIDIEIPDKIKFGFHSIFVKQ
jgi:hypothetical protein